MVMEIADQTAFLEVDDKLDEVTQALNDGPGDGEAPEAFLKRTKDLIKSLDAAFSKVTPEDVDDEYFEDEV